ncbi:nucleotidyltransferase family protein [Cellulomonas hominis]
MVGAWRRPIRPSVALARARAQVLDAVRRHGGHDAEVFGSVAMGTDRPDLDLVVSFDDGRDIVDLLALEADLEAILTVHVDVVSAGSSGPVTSRARREAVAL